MPEGFSADPQIIRCSLNCPVLVLCLPYPHASSPPCGDPQVGFLQRRSLCSSASAGMWVETEKALAWPPRVGRGWDFSPLATDLQWVFSAPALPCPPYSTIFVSPGLWVPASLSPGYLSIGTWDIAAALCYSSYYFSTCFLHTKNLLRSFFSYCLLFSSLCSCSSGSILLKKPFIGGSPEETCDKFATLTQNFPPVAFLIEKTWFIQTMGHLSCKRS